MSTFKYDYKPGTIRSFDGGARDHCPGKHNEKWGGAEMEYCASAASMLAEEFRQIAEGFVEVAVNL